MNTIIVGGVAAGVVIDVPREVSLVELSSRDGYIKPLERPREITAADIIMAHDIYEIHPVQLSNSPEADDPEFVMAIGVVKGKLLTWAVQQLITAYCDKLTAAIKEKHQNGT